MMINVCLPLNLDITIEDVIIAIDLKTRHLDESSVLMTDLRTLIAIQTKQIFTKQKQNKYSDIEEYDSTIKAIKNAYNAGVKYFQIGNQYYLVA